MMHRTFAAGLLALLVPATASAQAWLQSNADAGRAGVRVGTSELHTGVGVDVGYDSNWFLRSSSTDRNVLNGAGNGLPVVSVAQMRLAASLALANVRGQVLSPTSGDGRNIAYRVSGALMHREFLDGTLNDQRNTSGSAALDVAIAPGQPITLALGGGYARTVAATAQGNPDLAFARNDAFASTDLMWTPGSGTFQVGVGYRGRYTFLDNNPNLTNTDNTGTLRGRWLFRPRSALFVESSYGTTSFNTSTTDTRNTSPFRVRGGVSSLLTPRLGAMVAAGYFNAGLEAKAGDVASNAGGFAAQSELRYFFDVAALPGESADAMSTNVLALGFVRDVQPSFLGSFNTSSRGYLRASYLWGTKVFTSVEGGLSSLGFNALQFSQGTFAGQKRADAFTNRRVDMQTFAEYRITETLGANVTFRYTSNSSDVGLKQDPSPTVKSFIDLNWSRFEAFAGVRYAL